MIESLLGMVGMFFAMVIIVAFGFLAVVTGVALFESLLGMVGMFFAIVFIVAFGLLAAVIGVALFVVLVFCLIGCGVKIANILAPEDPPAEFPEECSPSYASDADFDAALQQNRPLAKPRRRFPGPGSAWLTADHGTPCDCPQCVGGP